MSLSLNFDWSPRWVSVVSGVEILMRPATSIDAAAASDAAVSLVRAALQGAEALAELGIPVPGAGDLAEPSYVLGLTRHLSAVELALRIVTQWKGVELDPGAPADLNKANLAKFFLHSFALNGFERTAYSHLEALSAEGKGSPLSPNGSLAGAANTAPAAAGSTSPAAAG